jgi:hypothetical protein
MRADAAVRARARAADGRWGETSERAVAVPRAKAEADEAAREEELCGIGLMLEHDAETGEVRVKGLAPGGPAARDGRLVEGDALVSVDGAGIEALSFAEVSRRIRGVRGSRVALQVERRSLHPASAGSPEGAGLSPLSPLSPLSLELVDVAIVRAPIDASAVRAPPAPPCALLARAAMRALPESSAARLRPLPRSSPLPVPRRALETARRADGLTGRLAVRGEGRGVST